MLNVTKLVALIAAFGLCLALAAPARAEKADAAKPDEHAKAEDHAKAGEHHAHPKPKKDPIAFTGYDRWDLALYTLIVFGLVFFVMTKYAFPNIAAGLKKREGLIAQAKEDALAAQRQAEEMRKKFEADAAAANDKIRGLMEEARRDADALRIKEREAGQKDAAAERDRAKREIEAAKDAALQEIYQKSVDLATLISTKAIRRTMNADDHRRLVDEALADLKTGRI